MGKAQMNDLLTIQIPSDPKYLSIIRTVTAKMGELSGLEETTIEDVKLAIDEACSNVIKHTYRGDISQTILIRFRKSQKGFEVWIEDEGIKVEPHLVEGRNLDDIRPGGLGVHLIKRAFDIFTFDQRKRKGNRLRLVRFTR